MIFVAIVAVLGLLLGLAGRGGESRFREPVWSDDVERRLVEARRNWTAL